MKLHIYLLLAILCVSCAAKKTTSGTKVKPKPSATAAAKSNSTAKAKTVTKPKTASSVATKSKSTAKAKTVTKPTPPKKPAPPVITKEDTTSTQKVLEVVPLASPDSDFKKP